MPGSLKAAPRRPFASAIATLLPLLCLSLLLGGCTVYHFDVVRPESIAGRVVSDHDKIVDLAPLSYRFRAVDNRLVIRIFNPTEDPIQLIGPQSVAVDPAGLSHPIPSQTIAPGAFIKLILPPPRPTVYRGGPSVGFGFGVFGGHHHHGGFYSGGVFYDEPAYYTVYDDNDIFFWDWPGETDTRLILSFQRGPRTFKDEFLFHRVKKS